MLKVRRVRSAEERNRSQFLTLPKVGDDFVGFALFTPDPESDDNPGYFEYFDHWDNKNNSYVPCADENCIFCKAGDRPSTRAKTLWRVDDEVKVFTLNWSMINEFSDMLAEDEKVLGQAFRIKRLDDRGKYRISAKADSMTKKELKALLEGDSLPDLEDLVTAQMRRSLEDLDVTAAMEEDEEPDEDEDETPKARRGKKKEKEPEPEDESEDLEDETVTITSVSKKNETIKVEGDNLEDEVLIYTGNDTEDFKKGMEIVISAEVDDDGDLVLSSWSEAEEETEEETEEEEDEKGTDDLPDEVEAEEMKITEVDADEETMDVEGEDYAFTLYFLDEGEAADIDFDDYEEGDTVIVSAVKDNVGDMVATAVPEKKKAKKTAGRKKAGKK